ncbi:MAG TPA: branched-chain amino acid ABC transporter permease, partial [Roseiflexaceae bacterium]|nr:branched-chain amino acid ABC transporter permease [Roseiflexaceae bacterium]
RAHADTRADPALVVLLAGVTAALHVGKLPPAVTALQDALGLTLVQAGFLLSLVQLAGMCAGVAFGVLADGLGLRRSLLLGLVESYGVAILGTSYRNLFAFIILIMVLVWRPNGIFSNKRQLPPEPLTGTFVAPSKPVAVPRTLIIGLAAGALVLPLVMRDPYLLQTLTNAWLYGMLALSLTLVAGTAGQMSLGHAGLLAIGGYASALLTIELGVPPLLAVLLGGVVTAILGTLLIFPAFRLRGHYVAIATLGIGEIVSLVILNWEGLTRGPIGISAIPPLTIFGYELVDVTAIYTISLVVLILLALLQMRLTNWHLGRTLRAIREDDIAARAYGISLNRYKGLAFAVSGFAAGISGAITAHMYSYINHETFNTQISVLALTMVILGGLGNILGAIVGAVVLIGLPELFRGLVEYRMLVYGIVLLLLVRFRPQGMLGTI